MSDGVVCSSYLELHWQIRNIASYVVYLFGRECGGLRGGRGRRSTT